MTARWCWADKRVLLLLHDESLADHGGSSGMRDEGLLDAALARALNLAVDEKPDLSELAASIVVGLAKNHPFVDGNQRAAFLALGLFLFQNGWRLTASQADATVTILAVAAGDINDAELANGIRANIAKR